MNKLKLLTLLSLLVLIGQVEAQKDYLPLAIEDAQWVIERWDPQMTPPIRGYYGYKIMGDTIINDITYKKVYRREFEAVGNYWEPPFIISEEYLFGAVRDEVSTGKVYAIKFVELVNTCSVNEEYLMFDYSLEVGDMAHETLCQLEESSEILEVNYYNWFGETRKVLRTILEGQLIEGIGSGNGLFEPVGVPVKKNPKIENTYIYIYCIGKDKDCLEGFILRDNEISNDKICVYPNPTNGIFTIKNSFQLTINNFQFSITDITGNIIINYQLSINNSKIDISNLPKGIYLLKIFDTNKLFTIKKIIKI